MYFLQKSLMIRHERLSSILKDNYHEAEFKDFKNFHFLRNVLLMVINMQFSPTESKISFSSVLNDNEKKGKYFASIRQQIQQIKDWDWKSGEEINFWRGKDAPSLGVVLSIRVY